MSKHTLAKSLRRQLGVSLIELMIAMTLGLVTVGAIGWIYFGSNKAYRTQDSLARLQEGARYAFEIIGNDLRMTGAKGCSYATEINTIPNAETNWHTNFLMAPLSATDKDSSAAVPIKYSDALRVLRADVSREYVVNTHVGSTFTLKAAHDLAAGTLMVVTNCDHLAAFQAATASGSTVTHSVNLGSPAGTVKLFGVGSRLYRLSASTYYVDNNPAGVPSLYRLRPVGASATPAAEELIEGVEDLQVTFGVDLDATADGQANIADPTAAYMTAAEISAVGSKVPGATPQERWLRVVSVRISLLMRTSEDQVVPAAQTYKFNGATVTATDRRLRKVFTHVVKLRNR